MNNSISNEQITIKIRTQEGCFCRSHSKETNRIIGNYLIHNKSHDFIYIEHETGPEIIAWLALGTAGLTVTKSVIDLIVAIINACKRGKEKGDYQHGKLLLIVRDTHRMKNSTEEIVLEIYDNDNITPEIVKTAIDAAVSRKVTNK